MQPDHPRIGPYELLAELGRGGAGVVFRARRPDLPRPVALKLILRGRADPTALARFEREAIALAKVRHPNVVKVHELGVSNDGPYLVTELVDGQSVDALSDGRPLSPRQAAQIALGLAEALTAVHAAGVVHRDLKPGNVLIRPDGSPVLLDFGLARDTQSGDRLTQTGMLTGTPSYMSPEQATGETTKTPDPRTDVYGLGATLYTLLTGEPPFVGSGIQVLASIVQGSLEWPGLATLPPGLVAICRRAMAKDPDARHPTADALRADLESWLAGTFRVSRPWGRAAAIGVAVLTLGLGVALSVARPAAPEEPPAAKTSPPDVAIDRTPPPPQAEEVRGPARWKLTTTLAEAWDKGRAPVQCAFVSDSLAVGVNSWRADVTVWDLDGGAPPKTRSLTRSVRCLTTAAGKIYLAANDVPQVLVCDAATPGLDGAALAVERDPRKRETGLNGQNALYAMAVDASGERLVYGDWAGTLRVVDTSSGEVLATAEHSATNGVGALLLRGDEVVTSSSASDGLRAVGGISEFDFRVCFWRLPDLQKVGEIRIPTATTAIALPASGSDVFVGTREGRIQRWTRSGEQTLNLESSEALPGNDDGTWALGGDKPRAHTHRVGALVADPFDRLYSLGHDAFTQGDQKTELFAWDATSGRQVTEFSGATGQPVGHFALSPNGRRALIGYTGGKFELWER